jgi:hypothetical protein
MQRFDQRAASAPRCAPVPLIGMHRVLEAAMCRRMGSSLRGDPAVVHLIASGVDGARRKVPIELVTNSPHITELTPHACL